MVSVANKKHIVNLILSASALLTVVIIASYLEPLIPLYDSDFLRLRLGWVLPVYITIFVSLSKSSIAIRSIRKANQLYLNVLQLFKTSKTEGNAEKTATSSYLGEATPLTNEERQYERKQFRPFEVLNHMEYKARGNLIEDARTQTLELWKSHHPDDYETLIANDAVELEKFEAELMPDDNERLRLRIVPVFSTVDGSMDADEHIYEMVENFTHDFHSRIIKLATVHDEFEPSKIE